MANRGLSNIDALLRMALAALVGISACVFAPGVTALGAQEQLGAQEPQEAAAVPDSQDQVAEAEAPTEMDADPAAAGDVELSPTDVETLQNELKQLGYFSGPADGRKGPRTRTAVRNFQRDQALEVTGSLDMPTITRIHDQVALAGVSQPSAEPPAPVPAPAPKSGGGGNPLTKIGGAFKATGKAIGTAGSATYDAGKTAGTATYDAGKTTGQAVGTAGAVTGRAVGTAGVAVGTGAAVAGKAIGKGTMAAYDATRHAIVGDRRGDDDIRQSIERQFASESRIVPGEIDVRVVKGNVTLALPDGAQSDIAAATRLARLTAGVKSVTTVYVSVDTYAPPQSQENSELPAPIVAPADTTDPAHDPTIMPEPPPEPPTEQP